jgi:hypothetical protein
MFMVKNIPVRVEIIKAKWNNWRINQADHLKNTD